MSASAEIIDKIKKLLRLSRSSNPHEAQLAMQRAMALAREHDVAVEGLNPDEQTKEKVITHRETDARQRMSYDKEYAVRICGAFFHITPVFGKKIGVSSRDGWPCLVKYVTFVGTAADVQIALYVYGFLVHHFSYCWRKFRGRLSNRHAYVDGMFYGVYSKLLENRPPHHAKGDELVLANHEAYILSVLGETDDREFRQPDHEAKAAKWAGFLQGQKTSILNPLKEGERTETLALR